MIIDSPSVAVHTDTDIGKPFLAELGAQMTFVGSFTSRPHAEMAASMLSAHGISADVVGDDAGGTAPHFNLGSGGGYTLDVPRHDREAAEQLLQARDGSGTDGETSSNSEVSSSHAIGRVFVALVLVALLGALVWSTVT